MINKFRCILHCIATMYSQFTVMQSINSITNLLTKFWKMNDDTIKSGILNVIQSYIKYHNRISQDSTEPLKFIQLGATDPSRKVKMNVAKCLYELSLKITPEEANSKLVEQALYYCIKGIEEPERKIRNIYALATGQIQFAILKLDEKKDEKTQSQSPKPSIFKKKEKVFNFTTSLFSLTTLFAKGGTSTSIREAITLSVIHFLTNFKENVIDEHLDLTINHLVGILSNPKLYVTSSDVLQAQYYIGKIIRYGITDNVSENEKLNILSVLCGIVSTHINNEYALVCILKEIGYLCKELGEVVSQKREAVLEAILMCLKHKLDYVRYAASICIRSLSESIPTQITTLVNAMLGLVQMDHAELAVPTNENETEYISKYATSLHGHATALGALISTTLKYDLSLQYHLCSAALDTSELLLNTSSNITTSTLHPYVMMRRQEACWVIISSIMSLSEDWVKLHLDKIFDCWDRAMGPKTSLVNTGYSFSLRTFASALLSINTFIKKCPGLLNQDNLNLIYKYIGNIVKLIESLSSDFQPKSSDEIYSINILKMNLFKVFMILPTNNQKSHILNFITKLAVAEADGTISKFTTSLLATELDPMDDVVEVSEDIPELSDYNIYEGAKIEPFEVDSSCVLENSSVYFEGNVLPISVRVVDFAILMLSKIFPFHKSNSRNQIIDNFVIQIKAILKTPDDVQGNNRVFTNVVMCVLFILKEIVSKKIEIDDKSFLTNVHAILLSCLGHSNSKVRRAAGEAMGLLSSLLGEVLLEDLTKRCTDKINGTSFIKIGYSLAIGHINKTLSITSHVLLPTTVSILQTFCRSNLIEVQSSSLHSLWYSTESAGIGFSPYIESVTQLLSMLIFSLKSHDTHLLLAAARNLQSQIGVYGPETTQKTYLVGLFDFYLHDFLSSKKISVKIEAISLVQRAIMLAPKMIKIENVIPFLKKYIQSTNDKLRFKTAECILVISKTQPEEICNHFPPLLVFELYDSSHENTRLLFKDIMNFQVSSKIIPPKVWIKTFMEINGKNESQKVYSHHTKILSLQSLRLLMKTHETDKNHVDLITANSVNDENKDFLIFHLQDIIKICNIGVSVGSTTTKYEALNLFTDIIRIFGEAPDPMVKEEPLLSQEAAQFISALGQGFEKSNPPILFFAACKLASAFIPHKMLYKQAKTLNRVCTHLISYLPIDKDIKFSQYGDIATTLLKLSVISSLGEIYNIAQDTNNQDLIDIFQSILPQLKSHWITALKDYVKLSYQNLEVNTKDTTFYQDGTQNQVFKMYSESLPIFIDSLSRMILLEENLDIKLILGLAVFGLNQNSSIAISCLKSITRMIPSKQYLNNSPGTLSFEIILMITKIQTHRVLNLQLSSLNLLKSILNHVEVKNTTELSENHFVDASIQLCLKSLKLHFPSLLELGSEQTKNCKF